MSGSSIKAIEKGRLWAVVAAAAISLLVAFGFAAPTQASAVENGTGLAVGSAQVATQADVSMLNPEWVDLWAGCKEDAWLNVILSGDINDVKIINAVSSNTAVLNVKKLNSEKTVWSYGLYPLKAGKAKVSVTISQNGTSQVLSETYTVKTMPKVLSSITFNGEALPVPSSDNPITTYEIFGFKGTKATLNVKAASGWEIMSISGYSYKQSTSANIEVTNGKEFAIPNGHEGSVGVSLYNSASGENFYYHLSVSRNMPLELYANATYYIGYPKLSAPRFKMAYNPSYIQVISVKSSNPAVISAKSNKVYNKIALQAKKTGKCKITIKYKYKDRTFTTSAMSNVSKDYPVKSASVNGKSLNLKKDSGYYSPKTYKKNKATVKITPAKGWKVKSIKRYNGYADEKGAKIKNGKSFKTPKGQVTYVIATLKKGKATYSYGWYFNRA